MYFDTIRQGVLHFCNLYTTLLEHCYTNTLLHLHNLTFIIIINLFNVDNKNIQIMYIFKNSYF